mmetsp:Transcript_11420/g.19102  ORF Transcript_11420/g.19102 Transcript_11420/m.19102 type:complete len:103 (+) Transcript_11420:81-389(+)
MADKNQKNLEKEIDNSEKDVSKPIVHQPVSADETQASAIAISQLLENLTQQFTQMAENVVERIDVMSNRLDQLESTMEQLSNQVDKKSKVENETTRKDEPSK